MAHIIVVGNEKGGAGKSTVSMHVATALARMGHKIGTLDLDLRQKTLGRYIANRQAYLRKEDLSLPTPDYAELPQIDPATLAEGQNAQDQALSQAVEAMHDVCDFILIDCPGSHTRLSQLAHAMSDTLVTPLNDSFVDFDLLAHVDDEAAEIVSPSVYAEMVWSARQMRAEAGMNPIDWIVLRNRLGTQAMINKQKMEAAINKLAKTHRVSAQHRGFSETCCLSRVVSAWSHSLGFTRYWGNEPEHVKHRRATGAARADPGPEPAGCGPRDF